MPEKTNPLNTSYNKTVYVSLFNAVVAVLIVFGPRFGWTPSGQEISALTGLGSALITFVVPNKQPE